MSTDWPRKPIIYEVNTRVWLSTLAQELGHAVTLVNVPDSEISRWQETGYHAIWLMGVWKTSEYSAALCRASEGLRKEAADLMGEIRSSDIDASPYAVAGYDVDAALGGTEGLASFRKRLASHGLRLVLDFVPNHLAVDHPWVTNYPDRFISGSPEQVKAAPKAFFNTGGLPLAHGRDPHFPPWTDTAQLNYFNPGVHDAMMNELLRVAAQCDGVRCDMAMLLLPRVFRSVWEWAGGDRHEPDCFWSRAIPSVKARFPSFRFIAEAYWSLENELQEKGFDYTYDKPLYDHLISSRTSEIHRYLEATHSNRNHAVRFIENHDEPRAAAILPSTHAKTAAAVILTLPGATLIHQGQEYGWKTRLPVQMRRKPPEPSDHDLEEFYRQLMRMVNSKTVQEGKWEKLLPETERSEDLLAYQWIRAEEPACLLFVANLTGKLQEGSVKAFCPSGQKRSLQVESLPGTDSNWHEAMPGTRIAIPVRLPPWDCVISLITDQETKGGPGESSPPEKT